MKYYLAGPMTGYPQFNIPLFRTAAGYLRAVGYNIVSPVELDSPTVRDAALSSTDGALDAAGKVAGESWGEILARDVRVVADEVDGIIVLPEWNRSRGARLEVFVALLCSKQIYSYPDIKRLPLTVALSLIVKGFFHGPADRLQSA